MENLIGNNGFVKVYKSMPEWEWYQHSSVFRVYIHLILKANYTMGKWQGHVINEGEHITSINRLSSDLDLSEFKIRDALKKLIETDYLKIETTNRFTKIILLNSAVYSRKGTEIHEQVLSQPTTNTITKNIQTATNKKEIEKEEIKERKEIFKNKISNFSNQFSIEHLNSFYEHWSQENKQTGRLKFEDEKYWYLESRIKGWKVFQSTDLKKKVIKNRP